ncbi:bacillithiol system redox-active protein YtxJ [Paenibacillus alvei]|uniref:bacillithiol system redox-active protein YtxJ n=1 Tax=Paenibacillus TaxID=44249 RepID=UPI0002885E8F|nr:MULTISPECIES: bacillithiol system redox-active protein YtxJ [Paenibacillus]EJW17480.1 bacillithiol system protein YtxJ [Paenibacillus alvei DSM 29]MCY7487093.1 bacillithiol system redox-active protein YtxJ [Paenibacillus alvei]MCY9540357.1 bacillithiol system redox-active protein YtxJ [Paenibacillus alvei]MCY9705874.1 bacillithiol system redox-active protein YtxJ [Paenibacillus alvei]MCY9737043.1 bacillithiol system redox-active protein YtxJ [Paenibacillus alvei]
MEAVTTMEELEAFIERSKQQTVVLFKHSTRCPISSHADEEMSKVAEEFESQGIAIGRILVVENRDVSLACADKLGIKHESPQVIVLRDGEPAWNESHHAIRYDNLESILTQ